jgi:hypothetical protein
VAKKLHLAQNSALNVAKSFDGGNKKMKKNFKFYAIIWAIMLALFNVIVFVVPVIKDGSFWAAYAFVTVAFIGQLACAYFAFKAENLQKMFYNVPLIKISYSGLITMLVFASIFMAIPFLPAWIAIVVCALILALNAISIVKASKAAELVEEVDQKVKVKTFFIKSLTVDADTLMARATTEEIKAECKKVYEAVRYSDPMSNDALATVESEITVKFAKLTEAVASADAEQVKELANEVVILIGDRNKKCKLLK